MRNHLKTTSEWPQSGPVTPLQSNEVGFAEAQRWHTVCACDMAFASQSKQGGTAMKNRPWQ